MRKFLSSLIDPAIVIIGAILLRLIPHMPNFAPIGAMALFGGSYLNKKYAIFIVLAAMTTSDYLLLYINPFSLAPIDFSRVYSPTALLHSTTLFVYGSFLLYFLIGKWIAKKKSLGRVIAGSLAASVLFFIITNFGVWAAGSYARGLDGLVQSYIMGLPFFRGTFLGDLFYTGVFFGGYELALRLVKKPKLAFAK